MVLPAVETIVYKKSMNNSHENYTYSYDYGSDNVTYGTYGNNHQILHQNLTTGNGSGNFPNKRHEGLNNYWALLAIILVLGTAAGNILVCLAIAWEKRLQNVTNYFLASLAITDLMVAILVMPLGIVTLFRGESNKYLLVRVV